MGNRLEIWCTTWKWQPLVAFFDEEYRNRIVDVLEICPFLNPLVTVWILREVSWEGQGIYAFCTSSAPFHLPGVLCEHTQDLPYCASVRQIINGRDRVRNFQAIDPVDEACSHSLFCCHGRRGLDLKLSWHLRVQDRADSECT